MCKEISKPVRKFSNAFFPDLRRRYFYFKRCRNGTLPKPHDWLMLLRSVKTRHTTNTSFIHLTTLASITAPLFFCRALLWTGTGGRETGSKEGGRCTGEGGQEKRGREVGFPRLREAGEKEQNYPTLRNISQSKKDKEAGANKYGAGTRIKGYGKLEA